MKLETVHPSSVCGEGLCNKFLISESLFSSLFFHCHSFSGGTIAGMRPCMDNTGGEACFVNIEHDLTVFVCDSVAFSHIPAKAKGLPCSN